MKNTAFSALFLLFLVSSVSAQFISPVPVIEREIRDNSSVKMRSIDLDRIKRGSRKKDSEKLGPASVNNFLEIKEDFEKIQKLEGAIVTTYKTGKQIQYAKIASFSAELTASAARLETNLFKPANQDQTELPNKTDAAESDKNLLDEVKNLIVELDNAVGAFVNNPIFQKSKKAGLQEKEQAVEDLKQIIRLSAALRQAAERQAQAKN
jgi:hypothetical protein